jgi:hypothetical protein
MPVIPGLIGDHYVGESRDETYTPILEQANFCDDSSFHLYDF